jgi:hypothetical protein
VEQWIFEKHATCVAAIPCFVKTKTKYNSLPKFIFALFIGENNKSLQTDHKYTHKFYTKPFNMLKIINTAMI